MHSDWIHKVKQFLRWHVELPDRLLFAVSGGADSMGMLALLRDELQIPPERLVIGHVHHGIRVDELCDLDVIHQAADERGIHVLIRKVNATLFAKECKSSLEAAARQLRYQSLNDMMRESGCQWILTAHTLDDSAETVWMRKQSGAPWYECTGIPARRGHILRPLIHVSRDDLRTWVNNRGLAFHEDATNSDLCHLRNRIRAEMAANPTVWNPSRKQELAQAGESVARILELHRRRAHLLPVRVKGGLEEGSIGLAIDRIFIYFKSLTFLPVEAAWAELTGVPESRLPSAKRSQISEFLGGTGPEGKLDLPHDVRLVRRGLVVWVMKRSVARVHRQVKLGKSRIPERAAVIEIMPNGSTPGVHLAARYAGEDLTLRSWQPGDRIKISKRPAKLISDLMRESRLSPAAREALLVLADEQGPLMIMNGPVAERALPTPDERNPLLVTWTADDRKPS